MVSISFFFSDHFQSATHWVLQNLLLPLPFNSLPQNKQFLSFSFFSFLIPLFSPHLLEHSLQDFPLAENEINSLPHLEHIFILPSLCVLLKLAEQLLLQKTLERFS